MSVLTAVRTLRLIASCALLGGVVFGVFFGWADVAFDPRALGATLGAALALTAKFAHFA